MPSPAFSRKQRVADQIGREMAMLLLTELNDPRTQGITLSGVDLSADMRVATIHITAPGESDIPEILKVLTNASGFLRRCLARKVNLRYLPKLEFRYDASLDRSDRIAQLLKAAANPDSNGT